MPSLIHVLLVTCFIYLYDYIKIFIMIEIISRLLILYLVMMIILYVGLYVIAVVILYTYAYIHIFALLSVCITYTYLLYICTHPAYGSLCELIFWHDGTFYAIEQIMTRWHIPCGYCDYGIIVYSMQIDKLFFDIDI